jgi:eukaryotic-like serine/threonine-protein kinase
MCFVAYPGAPFGLFLVYRVAIELLLLGVYRASLRETGHVVWLFRLLVVSFGAAALAIALMAIHLGGIRSPYMHGISIVALVWATLIPTHWRALRPTWRQRSFSPRPRSTRARTSKPSDVLRTFC